MTEQFTTLEQQLLYALTVALLSCRAGEAKTNAAVANCLESIERHYLIGNPSAAFDMQYCQFTGYLYHQHEGKRVPIGTLRIDCLGRARCYRQGPRLAHAIRVEDRSSDHMRRKEALRGIIHIDIQPITAPRTQPCMTPTPPATI